MTQQTSPFLEGKFGWSLGESGWNTGMDENLVKFSFMFDRNINGIVSSLPSPVNGEAYFLTTDNRLYFVVGGIFYSSPTPKYFTVVNKTTGQFYEFDGTSLQAVASNVGLDTRLDAVELVVSGLGSASTKDESYFAKQSDLDVAEAVASNYTDSLRSDVASNSAALGATIVGKSVRTATDFTELKTLPKTYSNNVIVKGKGVYSVDLTDTTSTDNNSTVIVAADGGRWKILDTGALNLKQYGGIGDGVTSSTTAITTAQANSTTVLTPAGTFVTSNNDASLTKNFFGQGQIQTSDGKRGKFFSSLTAPPTTLGNEGSVTTAFNGDWSHVNFAIEHRISGATTLGQPATGYIYVPEAVPNYTYLFNTSGWNQSTSSNVGRTGISAYRAKVDQYGQGDAVCFNASAFVTGTKAGSTHFLANPAAVLFNGDMTAGAAGTYMNPYETYCTDNGFDVACIGIVNNLNRTNGTGAKSAFWGGFRAQNTGTVAVDNLLSATGKWTVGLDLSMSTTDFGANQAAISLKSGQRIYFNNASNASGSLDANYRTTVFNGDYQYHNGTNIVTAVGGVPSLQVGSTSVILANTNGLSLTSTGILRFDGTGQYVTGTSTAAFTATNKPGATTGAGPAQWILVRLGGAAFYIPAWAS